MMHSVSKMLYRLIFNTLHNICTNRNYYICIADNRSAMETRSGKNLVTVLLCALMSVAMLSLTGCKDKRIYRIGVSQCSDDDWRSKMNDEIRREMIFHDNAEVEIRSADDSNDKQIADIRYFADNGFDIIIAAPNEANALTPVIKEVYESGTPVLIFDRNINGDYYTAFQLSLIHI